MAGPEKPVDWSFDDPAPLAYPELFLRLTGNRPFPYQTRLAEGPWPEVLDVPTGLGKTAAVVGAWLYKRLIADSSTGRRLVYCLPMRTLVRQTCDVAQSLCSAGAPFFEERGLLVPTVHMMLGGFVDEAWEANPERPAILVGTQDMLLSRALARGYAMSRYKWPIHFGLLHNDCFWVFDETQLMGVAVETSAQLEAFRRRLGSFEAAHTLWASATLVRAQLSTVDHPEPDVGFATVALGGPDRDSPIVRARTSAKKAITRAGRRLEKKNEKEYVAAVADLAAQAHRTRGGLTLVIVNRVNRAQEVYRAIATQRLEPRALLHSRFRQADREAHERLLKADGDRIVIATQAVEAGVDVSARTLLTELAPWPSMVQRFGRCNRYGEQDDARVLWLDLDYDDDTALATPYEPADLAVARRLVSQLADVSPASIRTVDYTPPTVVRPVLRHRDVVDLFDTTPDLLGNDVDVARFVRDGTDSDVQVFFRALEGEPAADLAPHRDELVRVSIAAAKSFFDALRKKRKGLGTSDRDRVRRLNLTPWVRQPLAPMGKAKSWVRADRVCPGQVVLLDAPAGGYDAELGWTGEIEPGTPVAVQPHSGLSRNVESMDADARTYVNRWVGLRDHLTHAGDHATRIVASIKLAQPWADAVVTAARWHDVGKAHAQFQQRLLRPLKDGEGPEGDGPWAKSDHQRRPPRELRPHFRHELASALAWLQTAPEDHEVPNLVAYLVAAHHGKVRLSIRSVPGERRPEFDVPFARGVWHGDVLPSVELPGGSSTPELALDLSVMRLGEGSWLERMLGLRNDSRIGPFRLAYLETLVRIADWRASEEERTDV
jgi:CRISPR-associated endonuclease/helicase Cas3